MGAKKVWLKRHLIGGENGLFQLEGDCGTDRIVVVLDPSVAAGPPQSARADAIVAMHGRIEEVATAKHHAGESYAVHRYHSLELKHRLIALTEEDLREEFRNEAEDRD